VHTIEKILKIKRMPAATSFWYPIQLAVKFELSKNCLFSSGKALHSGMGM
jgi:hypothetical protein